MWIPIWFVRKLYLKLFIGHLGRNTFISRNVDIRKPKNIYIYDNIVINKKVLLDGRGGILVIEDNVDIAQEANIWTLTHDKNSPTHAAIGFPVRIKSHSWVGARSTIMPGVVVGKGAIIAVNAVVTKNVDSKSIVGGIPAKVIGYRDNNLNYTLQFRCWFM